jgi:uncharacterized protein YoxC
MEIAYGEQIKRNIDSGDLDEVANVISQWELYTDELERDIQNKVAVIGMLEGQIQELGGALNSMTEEMEESSFSRNKKNQVTRII